jgi:peptidoglycan/LPS O-acetylase OafA/YrhL
VNRHLFAVLAFVAAAYACMAAGARNWGWAALFVVLCVACAITALRNPPSDPRHRRNPE